MLGKERAGATALLIDNENSCSELCVKTLETF